MTRTPLVDGLIWSDGTAEMREARRLYDPDVIEHLRTRLPHLKRSRTKAKFAEEIIRWAAGYLEVKQRWQRTARARRTFRLQVAAAAAALVRALRQLDSIDRVSLIDHLPQAAVSTLRSASPTGSRKSWGAVAQESLDARGAADEYLQRTEEGIVSIEQAAKAGAHVKLPKAGRPTPVQGVSAVIALCEIYEAATGCRPTRRWKETSGSYGPFREFVIAALTPLEEKRAPIGIDGRIKRALKARKRR